MLRLRTGQPRNRGAVPGRCKRFFGFVQRSPSAPVPSLSHIHYVLVTLPEGEESGAWSWPIRVLWVCSPCFQMNHFWRNRFGWICFSCSVRFVYGGCVKTMLIKLAKLVLVCTPLPTVPNFVDIRSLFYINTWTVHHFLFCTVTNKCTIISQIITLLHVSTLPCNPQGTCNEYLTKLHKYFKFSCW